MKRVKKHKKNMITKILEIDSFYRRDDVLEDIFKLKNIRSFNNNSTKKWDYSLPTLINANIKRQKIDSINYNCKQSILTI